MQGGGGGAQAIRGEERMPLRTQRTPEAFQSCFFSHHLSKVWKKHNSGNVTFIGPPTQ